MIDAMTRLSPTTYACLLRCLACAGLLFSQAASAHALPAGCDLGEQAHWPLTFTEDMRPVGQATVNGATVSVMLSTSTPESVMLNKKVLDRLGIAARSTTTTLFASDLRGEGWRR